jgi:hypothetical protein
MLLTTRPSGHAPLRSAHAMRRTTRTGSLLAGYEVTANSPDVKGMNVTASGNSHCQSTPCTHAGFEALAAQFAELIPAGHRVLDVGCGDGLIDQLLLDRRPDLPIAGVETLVRPGARIPVTPLDGTRLRWRASRGTR